MRRDIMATSDILPIEPLDISDPQGVTDWHERFEQYYIAKNIDSAKTVSYYVTLVGKNAYRLLKDPTYPSKVTSLTVAQLQKNNWRAIYNPKTSSYPREKNSTTSERSQTKLIDRLY